MAEIECKVGMEYGRCTYQITGSVTDREYRELVRLIATSPHIAGREVTRSSHILVVVDLFDTSLPRDVDELIRSYFADRLGKTFVFKHDAKYRL